MGDILLIFPSLNGLKLGIGHGPMKPLRKCGDREGAYKLKIVRCAGDSGIVDQEDAQLMAADHT